MFMGPIALIAILLFLTIFLPLIEMPTFSDYWTIPKRLRGPAENLNRANNFWKNHTMLVLQFLTIWPLREKP